MDSKFAPNQRFRALVALFGMAMAPLWAGALSSGCGGEEIILEATVYGALACTPEGDWLPIDCLVVEAIDEERRMVTDEQHGDLAAFGLSTPHSIFSWFLSDLGRIVEDLPTEARTTVRITGFQTPQCSDSPTLCAFNPQPFSRSVYEEGQPVRFGFYCVGSPGPMYQQCRELDPQP